MQPHRATRGIAAVALSSAAAGLLLLTLALVLSACTASSAGRPAASTTASTPAGSSPAATGPSATGPSATGGTAAAPATSPAATAPASSNPVGPPATDETVPSVPVTTAPPVPLTAAAPAAGGGTITIGTITSLQGTAQLPGEINGPAVSVPVTFVNGTGAPVDLAQIVVDLVDSHGVSAGQLSASPAAPFSGTLAPRATARAVYVFTLATDDRRGISIVVSYTTAAPVVVFTGTIA